jgi:oligopeptide/dipeptide ABC transporter ATP-binding protein
MSRTPNVEVADDASSPKRETAVLDVRNLEVNYGQSRGHLLRAVNDVSFTVKAGRTLGIVGESGSGKTTVIRAVLRIIDAPGQISGGQVLYNGRELLPLPEPEMGKLRGNRIAMIFQDPSGSLDPLQTIGAQFIETIRRHRPGSRAAARQRAMDVLSLVGVSDPAAAMKSYPMEFSAGMTQRIMIGMAISCDPDVILADEPTTGLGVVVQASILAELQGIQARLGTALVLITHDMGIVSYIADDILVMYAGKCVEYSTKEEALTRPMHPYTVGLMQSIPREDQDPNERLKTIPGFPPDISALPAGCPFFERCYRAIDECATANPALVELEPNHFVACHSPVPEEERNEAHVRANS